MILELTCFFSFFN